jgi:hypothetical protein
MRKIIQQITTCLLAVAIFPACESWLDATAASEVREENQFSMPTGFEQALIGCYIAMNEDMLYGYSLTWGIMEAVAQQFDGVSQFLLNIKAYNYETPLSKGFIDAVWSYGYNVIANTNNALAFIETRGAEVLHPIEYSLIKGELLAIRAYMHFDLLRVFGYGTYGREAEIAAKYTLPYVTQVSKTITPQFKGSDYIKALLDDLEEAERLLAEVDPILNKHDASVYEEINKDGFFNNRTKRLNYYAVKALQARVYLWEGSSASKARARAIALETIAGVKENNVVALKNQVAGDNALNGEALFRLQIRDFSLIESSIKFGLMDVDISHYPHIKNVDLDALYEISSSVGVTDWRYTDLIWKGTHSIIGAYGVPYKLYQTDATYYDYKNILSLFRLPELYYIAAETYVTGPDPDLGEAMSLLNEVRTTRGITTPLSGLTAGQVEEEITKEYKKEFLLEGVMFFYYKRKGFTTIPRYVGAMSDAQYVWPFPDIEISSGRVQ